MTTADVDEREEVLESLRDMYRGYLENDRSRFDRHLHDSTTTWESHLPRLYSRAELDAFRDARSAGERPAVAELRVEPRRVEVWGATALAAYLLVVVPPGGGEPESTRITDVLRREEDGWRIVHHHAVACDVPDEDRAADAPMTEETR
ncbi:MULTISPECIES: YybH family protein [unclassified Rathayibacter]|uniref:YybH family protein n=1 Tax=unclassified Rathayibacter TaxID=2609250 RepID=UPI0006F82EA9|nr:MULTISPECIES: DUF4440 domain-containing protein [unclassified Rathayibacter]KQQ05756.1 hypothetical protein ASF42_04115 [Rathayibacter sp. Leaf294]KQS13614.1 hypothetical protein ASG06_04125 [Rathayibacter sp. Leaf185]